MGASGSATGMPNGEPINGTSAGSTKERCRDGVPRIGSERGTVRALAFAGGGYDAAVQIGVIHALLVSRATAPNLVLGVSAGAVNATVLAEVLQTRDSSPPPRTAGGPHDPKERAAQSDRNHRAAQAARFRGLLEAVQASPGDLITAALPDTIQIETERPLKPLELPIHNPDERDQREAALGAKTGLVQVYNRLLQLRISVGTFTRVIRRVLGVRAAREAGSWPKKVIIWTAEFAKLWVVLGFNLHRVAPLGGLAFGVTLRSAPVTGATAGELIFRSRFWGTIRKGVVTLITLLALSLLWTLGTSLLFGAGFGLAWVSAWPLMSLVGRDFLALGSIPWPTIQRFTLGLVTAGGVVLLSWLVVSLARIPDRFRVTGEEAWTGRRRQYLTWLNWWWGLLVQTGKTVFNLVLLFVIWLIPATLVIAAYQWRRYESMPFATLNRLQGALGGWILGGGLVLTFTFVVLIIRRLRGKNLSTIPVDILRRNGIGASILNAHPLRELFVKHFDPEYYCRADLKDVVENALRRKRTSSRADNEECAKKIRSYREAEPSLHLGLVAADVGTGDLVVMPEETPVVEGLLAATAVAPLLPPVKLDACLFPEDEHHIGKHRLFVDGSNVANEPTRSTISYLRKHVHPEVKQIHLYPVAPLPITSSELGPRGNGETPGMEEVEPYQELVDVITRALQLQRFRDSNLERRLTRLFSKVIPREVNGHEVALFQAGHGDGAKNYLRAGIFPIEPEQPLEVNRRLLDAKTETDRRRIVAQTVADGCRLALESMVRPAILESAGPPWLAGNRVSCKEAISAHLRRHGHPDQIPELPGSDPGDEGPGMAEVCRHCSLDGPRNIDAGSHFAPTCALSVKPHDPDWPEWPVFNDPKWPKWPETIPEDRTELETGQTEDESIEADDKAGTGGALDRTRWPRGRAPTPPSQESTSPMVEGGKRPTVSVLFSGGVFRGVFQVGVLNALNEVGLQPDIVAGASVGSITAAMAATIFSRKVPSSGGTSKSAQDESDRMRREQILRLSATYLAMDRLVLTDRFADFIRDFTVRAAQTQFSLRHLDRVFRRYDAPRGGRFDRELRMVLAGLERLFYVSPFEVRDLLDAQRRRDRGQVVSLLREYFQEILNRSEVHDQLLGAEPLALLIEEHVVRELPGEENGSGSVRFDAFLEAAGIHFLATATNLTQGRLEVLGSGQHSPAEAVNLREGLLASSAFPGVFRPRWSWEVVAEASHNDLYIDGGVMDNLPLDAVSHFLVGAAEDGVITPRPKDVDGANVPHLLFSASLREDPKPIRDWRDLKKEYTENWIALMRRTRTLGYNEKLTMFGQAQRAIRKIVEECEDREDSGQALIRESVPLDIEVLVVKPKWLCGTFGFHPMLGFRRDRQARSIAHGCAETLRQLGDASGSAEMRRWMRAWSVRIDQLPLPKTEASDHSGQWRPHKKAKEDDCWIRHDCKCPFARKQLELFHKDLPGKTRSSLARIHKVCGQRKTHYPR